MDFSRGLTTELRSVETSDTPNAALTCQERLPELSPANTVRRDDPDAGNDNPTRRTHGRPPIEAKTHSE
jgi:hypothetical protein